jgi:hypothetical protein
MNKGILSGDIISNDKWLDFWNDVREEYTDRIPCGSIIPCGTVFTCPIQP